MSLPRLDEYLATLPAGMASHPECQIKGGALAQLIDTLPSVGRDQYPLQHYFRDGVLPSSWYPEVHMAVLTLATREIAFPSDAGFLEWMRDGNLKLFQSKLYYRLMKLVSPRTLLQRGSVNWSQFHRGSEFVVDEIDDGHALARLRFPSRLFSALHARALGKAFEAALVFNGAAAAALQLTEISATEAHFVATW